MYSSRASAARRKLLTLLTRGLEIFNTCTLDVFVEAVGCVHKWSGSRRGFLSLGEKESQHRAADSGIRATRKFPCNMKQNDDKF
jgi:hypothetical protein